MGCDIHAHIEVKKDGIWHHFSTPKIERNYHLFAVIAGVRMDLARENEHIRPVAKVHRLPDDISLVTKCCHEQDKSLGIHDTGILTAHDLVMLQEELYRLNPHVERTGIDQYDLEHSIFKTYINGNTLAQHQGWDDVRIIFWFDN